MTGKKILIVEDNAIVALETKERLKRLGYTIAGVTGTGRDAINLARTAIPDLLLVDINLKGDIDGITVTEQIAAFMAVPVIYITAYSNEETKNRALKTRPVAYLVKPFREQDLYRSIEMALGTGTGQDAPAAT
jgi:two-component system, response regulator PdtaR